MRIEEDSLGKLKIPDGVYYGIQSFRASKNFPISQTQVHPELIRSYLLLKKAAAIANQKTKALDPKRARAIVKAVDTLLKGKYLKHFIIDAYQAGAGTSQNMNTNEVIANKACEILGNPLGSYDPVNPNDHVNMSQSTNDTYPTVLRLTLLILSNELVTELELLAKSFDRKAKEFSSILKAARTHLQDAVPITLGLEFSAYRDTILKILNLLKESQNYLSELGIGGSAAGTGVNVPKNYRPLILKELQKGFQLKNLKLAPNLCEAMQSQMPVMIYSNVLRTLSLELTRILNDLRLLSSGPTNGFAEIFLPSTQPGSSIMPGKVNPSILEMGNQVLFKVLGNDTACAFAMQAGQLELNVMMPLQAQVTLESTALLTTMLRTLRLRSIDGIKANRKRCQQFAEQTTALATALNPIIGYSKAAEITKESLQTGKTIIELVREKKLLSEKQIQRMLEVKKHV